MISLISVCNVVLISPWGLSIPLVYDQTSVTRLLNTTIPPAVRGTGFCKYKEEMSVVSDCNFWPSSHRSPLLPQTSPPGRCDISQRMDVYTSCTSCAAITTSICPHGFSKVHTTNCRYVHTQVIYRHTSCKYKHQALWMCHKCSYFFTSCSLCAAVMWCRLAAGRWSWMDVSTYV